ncbi:GNAT family N-acetyltransferase [Dyella acidisoli]|uniref:N-acetyltransferase n=1 Tax=Dyella acidisoli TaxID=1867834 RepID=A0ABQ5XMP0_9GAMM|nr:GNAT family N-acetyltransferase [Dyella acidisoli]GLQ92838.1 N-acetyltransferase [Dyella acidisoli]
MLIRPAEPEDALSVARVHVRAWQVGYRHLLPAEYLTQLRAEERAQRYNFATQDVRRPMTIVAMEDDAICGFATTAPSRDSDIPDHGELCALYVDPDRWGRGIGAALIAAARRRLAELGYQHAMLWLLAGNQRGERFYRADNWTPDGLVRTDRIWGIAVDEIRYQRLLRA